MRWVFGWMLVMTLGCATAIETGRQSMDARLLEAQAAINVATKLKESGGYSAALVQAEHALALRKEILGDAHPDVASCLNLLGELYLRQGDMAHAEQVLVRALAIRESVFGQDHLEVAQSLNLLAYLHQMQGSYEQAQSLFERALAIREAILGPNHSDVARALNNLANLYEDQGMYSQTAILLQRALTILETTSGKNHLDVAVLLNSLAALDMEQGFYNSAESRFQRSLAIREAALGPNHPDVAILLSNLAALYWVQGLYHQAESFHHRALAIQEVVLGPNHLDVADSLNNIANLYSDRGLYGLSESLLQRALTIREAVLGPNHPDVADSFSSIAALYAEQGLYSRAEPLLRRAIGIMEASFDKNHPRVAQVLNSLSALYLNQGFYSQAEPLLQRALAIREASLDAGHHDLARTLNNLAIAYSDQGLYSQAEPLFERALSIRKAALGEEHPEVAHSLRCIADLYADQGLYERAEPLLRRSLTIREKVLGESHPLVVESLDSLARLRLGQHRLAEALPLLARSFAITEQRLRVEALDFSESRLSEFLKYVREDEQFLYALLRAHPDDARVRRLVLGAVLLRKGRSLEETANVSRILNQKLGEADQEALERLRGLRTQLAALSLEGPGASPAEAYQLQYQSLIKHGDMIEADLASRSAPLRALTALPGPWDIIDRVARSLSKDSALIEFIDYEDKPLSPKAGVPTAKRAGQSYYLALVLFPDASTRAVALGRAESLDAAISRFREALTSKELSAQVRARELHSRVFAPLLPLLGKTRRLVLSPDGQLGLVPFAALHDGRGYLVDSFDFTYVTSGRELLPRLQQGDPASSVIVLANPRFSAPTASGKSAVPSVAAPLQHSRLLLSEPVDPSRNAWEALPGTLLEAEGIRRLLPQARLFLGADATKERLLHLTTPGILHVATHGFFLGDSPSVPGARALGFIGSRDCLPPPQQEPLLNSGLVLSESQAGGTAPACPHSSLVTALELAGLDLWGTQLVVLSACDTGRGNVHLGQGISGLRRALVVAGAETVVMSLWKVDDDATRLLMDGYYRSLLAGRGRASALREAMRSLRKTHPHPHDWASFIAVGSDAPLRGITPVPSLIP
ncbi:CHAT domain-containing tetratricopeptide repeat protein [Archangium primigenium]|uniref:CHAT domain-containing tetratricopeptide repeat protein n=1 Tax=[Archangium] primigenium TaxID=2792470 RepID=UPI00195B269D|nr:CHAT domain-containing tetratricopeptide repeat protein [Archangium primigenium]MBM7115770.1 CHAT domain-containing protein [Archangium primigenium]